MGNWKHPKNDDADDDVAKWNFFNLKILTGLLMEMWCVIGREDHHLLSGTDFTSKIVEPTTHSFLTHCGGPPLLLLVNNKLSSVEW